jgi:hypothetical protein
MPAFTGLFLAPYGDCKYKKNSPSTDTEGIYQKKAGQKLS